MPAARSALKPLHQLWRTLPASSRRVWLARVSAQLAPRPMHPAPGSCDGIIVGGEIRRASGLGEGARIAIRALETLGVAVWSLQAGIEMAGEAGALAQIGADARSASAAAALLLHVNAPVLPAALLKLPRASVRGRRVIGYWAWELGVVPPSWHPAVRCVHEVWAPSRFTAAALETLMPGRVRVVPHPLALSPPVPALMGRSEFGLPEGAVVVLVSFSLASSFDRKNPLAAIAAFRRAFGSRGDRILVLKIGHAEHSPSDMAIIREAIFGCENIRLETRMLPPGQTHALTRLADIVLSLHRSEGFGLVPAEAMMLGRAVVATDWSATAEFLDASCAAPVGYRLVPARDRRGVFEAPGAVWAEADIDAAAGLLADLADQPHRREWLGAAARRKSLERFGPKPLIAALRGIGYARAETAPAEWAES